MSLVQASKQLYISICYIYIYVLKRNRTDRTNLYYNGALWNLLIKYVLGFQTCECLQAENLVHKTGWLSSPFLVLKASQEESWRAIGLQSMLEGHESRAPRSLKDHWCPDHQGAKVVQWRQQGFPSNFFPSGPLSEVLSTLREISPTLS